MMLLFDKKSFKTKCCWSPDKYEAGVSSSCSLVFPALYFLLELFVSLRVDLVFVRSVAASPLAPPFEVAESFERILLDEESPLGEESWKIQYINVDKKNPEKFNT